MEQKHKEEDIPGLTSEEINEIIFEEQLASGERDGKVFEYYFSALDPYAKLEPRPEDAPKHDVSMKTETSLSKICQRSGCRK